MLGKKRLLSYGLRGWEMVWITRYIVTVVMLAVCHSCCPFRERTGTGLAREENGVGGQRVPGWRPG